MLANAEVLVTSQPQTKRAEGGFPTKLAEYMMSKTVALVTNVGEIHKYVSDGDTVYMAPPCNPVEYATKLKYILHHKGEAQQVADKAYDFAIQHFSAKEVTIGMINFLASLLVKDNTRPIL